MPSFVLLLIISLAAASPKVKKGGVPKVLPAVSQPTTAGNPVARVSLPAAPGELTPEAAALLARLEAATLDLQMPSETDAPFRARFWPSEKGALSSAEVALLAEQSADARVEVQTVAAFFAPAATVEEWMSADERATAARFGKLVATLEAELEHPQVYLFGERERTVVVIGKVKGGFGGLVTLVVET